MKHVNVKVLGILSVVLLLALIAIYLFVPKHLTTDGKVVTFKKNPTPPTAPSAAVEIETAA